MPTTPPTPGTSLTPSPGDLTKQAPPKPSYDVQAEGGIYTDEGTGYVFAEQNVTVQYGDATITSDRLEGNFHRELIFSGNAKLKTSKSIFFADAVHVYPQTRTFRLDNPRGLLEPSALQNRVIDPVFLTGGELLGRRDGFGLGTDSIITTCIEPEHHYELRARSAELIPDKKLTMRHVAVYFFGKKLVVLPTLVIPLDRRYRRYHTDYLPEFGQNINEGYYARFPYVFAVGSAVATFLRFDATQKLGEGYRLEQEYLAGKQDRAFDTSGYGYGGVNSGFGSTNNGAYNTAIGYGNLNSRLPRLGTGLGPQNGGLFAMQGYFNDGFSRNFNASFRHQQGIGGSNRFAFSSELRRDSYYTFSDQTAFTNRFDFAHNDQAHGVNADFNINWSKNNSTGFGTDQFTAALQQSFDFASLGSTRNNLAFNLNLNRYLNTTYTLTNRTADITSQVELKHSSREYTYDFLFNKNSPFGPQSGGSSIGSLERLPEFTLSLDTPNFKGGWLRKLPSRFDLGLGIYSEPSSSIQTQRVTLGYTLQDVEIMRGRTEMTFGGGFEQRMYGDDAAQYVLRNTTRLRQHLGGRSGIDLNYQYQEPAGGTPFLFDTFGRYHNLTAEAGYLDDSHFQFTVRAGYDFLGTSVAAPWQSVSPRLMWRPSGAFRLDALATYDPNTSRLFSATGIFRFRGRNDFGLDLYTLYDPNQGKFSQINSQFDIPLGRTWRLAGLLRYNGFRGAFDATNLQLTHTWDCLEASVTYSETPSGFRNDRQFFFLLRITAFPFFRSFARGPGGDALGPGIGTLY